MNIRVATEEDQTKWDQYVLTHPEGVAYQLFAWKQAVKMAYGYDSLYLIAEAADGICGVLPLINFKFPFIKTSLISLPYCDAGGVLADNEAVASALLEEAFIKARQFAGTCHIRSIESLQTNLTNSTEKARMVLDLPESAEAFMAGLKSKLRTKIKKPLKNGYVTKSGSAELIGPFYAVFAENMHHLGSPVHSRRWVEAIVSAYKENSRIFIVFSPDGKPVSAAILLLHSTTVSNPWASSLRQFNYMKPNMLLYSELISYAADNGYKKFDFGRSTLGEGTYAFKEQWGASPYPLYWYDYPATGYDNNSVERDNGSSSRFSKRELAVQLWQKLPAGGANWLGPKLRKYISL